MTSRPGEPGRSTPTGAPADWRANRSSIGLARASMSTAEVVADELARMISERRAGERLGSKEEVREWCEVSVGTFNEAVRLLQTRGVIDLRRGPGGGIFVAAPSSMKRLGLAIFSETAHEPTLAEAFRIRAALDVLLVADAVSAAGDDETDLLRGYVDDMFLAAERRDGALFARANWEFHERLCLISDNSMLRPIYLAVLDFIRSQSTTPPASIDESMLNRIRHRATAHATIVDAIVARDSGAAAAAIDEHNRESWVNLAP